MAKIEPHNFDDYRIPRIRKTEDWEPVFDELFKRINIIGRYLAEEAAAPDDDDSGDADEKDWLTKAAEHPLYGPKVVELLTTVGEELGEPGRIKKMVKGALGKLSGLGADADAVGKVVE